MLIFNKTTLATTHEEVRVPAENEVAWIRLQSPEPAHLRYVLEDLFCCHPLLVEDCIKMNQRPKMDRYKEHIFISFHTLNPDLSLSEIAIIIGNRFVITNHLSPIPYLDELEQEFEQIEGKMEHPGQILYHILDRCVDEYVEATNQLDARIDRLERSLYRNPHVRIAQEVFKTKRTLHLLRRTFVEERSILGTIGHQNFPYTRQESDVYFIDIYDHISRVIDSLDIYRESLNGLLEMQMNLKSDRMNEIMKTLTIVSSFFLPLTFIVGIYGMNFDILPELHWKYGYMVVWVVMIVVAIGMWFFYKRKKWL